MTSRFRKLIPIAALLLFLFFVPVSVSARAGGGGDGGGGDGGGGGTTTGTGTGSGYGGGSLLGDILNFALAPLILCSGAIAFTYHLKKKARNNRKLMSRFDDSDPAWKFADIKKRVEESFYVIQQGWSNRDLTKAGSYLSDELRKEYSIKLEWMALRSERNILKEIRLDSIEPVAVSDSKDNSKDYIWFYIRAHMVDYVENEQEMSIESGSTNSRPFVEFWMFTREHDAWVLNRILQEKEGKQMFF